MDLEDEMPEIKDPSALEALKPYLETFVEDYGRLSRSLIHDRNWVIVPYVYWGSSLGPDHRGRIVKVAERLGVTSAHAIVIENYPEMAEAYKFTINESGMLAFEYTCCLFDAMIVPDPPLFVVLQSYESYHLVAGPKDIVEEILGESISSARDAFCLEIENAGELVVKPLFLELKKDYIDPCCA